MTLLSIVESGQQQKHKTQCLTMMLVGNIK